MDYPCNIIFEERKIKYNFFLDKAKYYFNINDLSTSIKYCEIAARYATEVHSGFFYDAVLENLLKQISSNLFNPRNEIGKSRKDCDNILHIATQVADTGGHTRLLLNWIDNDKSSNRKNDILLTNMPNNHFPDELLNSYSNTFNITKIVTNDNDVHRIKTIREIALRYDFIVLHIHPEDVQTVIALSGLNKPIIFMNHADHRFWVGRSISNLVLEFRDEGAKTSNLRRDILPKNQYIIPIILKKPINISKREARKQIGIEQDKIIIFSVASSYKYKTIDNNGLSDVIINLANKFNNLQFIFIGPHSSESYWKEIIEATKGKVLVLGEITNIELFYISADIYLDSYPIGSLTSLLDAVKYKLPIISVKRNVSTCEVSDISLDDDFKVNSLEELEKKLELLICDISERQYLIEKYYERVYKYHVWNSNSDILDHLYKRAFNESKLANEQTQNVLMEERDNSIAFLYFKNRSRNFEFSKVWAWYYEKLPFNEKEEYLEYLSVNFKENTDEYYALLPKTFKR
ncbi:hypothetical protein [Psychrobacillus sp. NPDC096623]|uniref:hypothetical protein n=1 Tax=Psychrobacillus sp. NPDC096623 TaxID=3364492 RepID=UPI003808E780